MDFLLHIFLRQVLMLSIWLAILAVIFVPLERAFALRAEKIVRKAFWIDIGFYFLNSLLPAFLMAVPMAAFASLLYQIQPENLHHFIAALPVWLRFILGLFVMELGSYWGHRWSHTNGFLWRFHSVHHAPTHLDWLVNTHAHPLDVVYIRLCSLVPFYALGLAPPASGQPSMLPVVILIVATIWSFFVHANVKWRFGFLEYFIVTPAFHHWHHTNDEHTDKNYATTLAFLDRFFGSLYLPKSWPPSYGLADEVVLESSARLGLAGRRKMN